MRNHIILAADNLTVVLQFALNHIDVFCRRLQAFLPNKTSLVLRL